MQIVIESRACTKHGGTATAYTTSDPLPFQSHRSAVASAETVP